MTTPSLAWRQCVCGAWYWGSPQSADDTAHSRLQATTPHSDAPHRAGYREDCPACIENDQRIAAYNQTQPILTEPGR